MLTEKENAGGVGGKGDGGLPGEGVGGFGELLEIGGVGGGGEEGEDAIGLKEIDGDRDGGTHLIDGAEGDAGVTRGEGFGAGCVHLGVGKVQRAECFAEEGSLLVLGLGERDGDLRAEDGDGQAGEAGSRAEVEQGGEAGGQGAGAEDGFEKVAAEDAFFIADGGEVGTCVPPLQKSEIGGELRRCLDVQGCTAGLGEELVEAGRYELIGYELIGHGERHAEIVERCDGDEGERA